MINRDGRFSVFPARFDVKVELFSLDACNSVFRGDDKELAAKFRLTRAEAFDLTRDFETCYSTHRYADFSESL